MDEGAPSGEPRRDEEEFRRDVEQLEALVHALAPIVSAEQLEALVSSEPALFGPQMLECLRHLAGNPILESQVRRYTDLVERAHSEPVRAWRAFQEQMDEMERQGREFEPVLERLEQLIRDEAYDDAIKLGEESLPRALQLGLGVVVGEIHRHLAEAFQRRVAGDPGDNIDAAIDHTDGALAAVADPARRVPLQMNLAVLVASRKKGDPAENFEHGIQIIREAHDQLDDRTPGDLGAIIQMNLGHMLQMRERGNRLANLREARDFCEASLGWRSIERNAEDWAYTKINLAAVIAGLALLGEADPGDAERHLQDVIDVADNGGVPPWLIGAAHGSLGGLHRRAAERIANDEGRTVIGPGRPPPGEVETERLESAREHLNAALALLDLVAHRDRAGAALDDLGAVEEALGNDEDAITAYRRAHSALRPTAMPEECQHAGGRLGELLAHRGDWEGSAAAYTTAIEAGEFAFHARLETADRAAQLQRAGNLARWAAFALAKTAATNTAVLVLENSRTRELRRRLGLGTDEALLEQLPPDARVDYQQALHELSIASFGSDSDHAGRQLQEVLTGIRMLPGFTNFAMGATWADIAAAVEPDSPLVYVNPTPFGTVLLTVAYSDSGISSAADFLDSPSALDVFIALAFGDMQKPSGSYLAGASGANDDPVWFRRGLDYVLGVLGESIARRLAACLRNVGATGATIVASGPISQAPLHAATWSSKTGEVVSLLDMFNVRFSPSATLHGECLRRARERTDDLPSLTALGNPDLGDPKDDLPAAEAEVSEIARHFRSGHTAIATRRDATRAFLAANAGGATHLHLACHAKGGLLEPEEAGMALSDDWVPAVELARHSLRARLTVVSACETAVAEIMRLPDEAFSLSTAFLAAGSASAVATLWSIDDAATALLMTRFYEELFNGNQPARALRSAQRWLRDLNEAEETTFLATHPALEKEFQRRTDQGRRPGLRSARNAETAEPNSRPYSAPEFWAAFVLAGR